MITQIFVNNFFTEVIVKNYSKWKNEEVINLFATVEKFKKENKSLLEAFAEYSKLSGRKRNSIRNYYYLELANLQQNTERAKSLNINTSLHLISPVKSFSEEETNKVIKELLKLKCMGYSVRKACLKLANNDINEMVRIQNKYRSLLKTNPNFIKSLLNSLKQEGLSEVKETTLNNVVYFKKPEPKTVSEKDINTLFLGLIKLVKKSAAESVEKSLLADLDFANSSLRKTLVKLSKTEQELKETTIKLKNQEEELNKLKLENSYLKTEIANFLTLKNKPENKQKTLSAFINEIKQKQIKKTIS